MQNYENLKNYTVLYVEDEPQSVTLVQSILENKVKKTFIAYDGVQGLYAYKKHLPDIVISDIQMPNKDGITLAKEIKKINPKQNIILITAFNENHLLLEAINLGITKYIIKPIITLEAILEPLNDICKVLSFDQNEKNEQRLDAMEEILKTIAHHWRQPLNIISVEASGSQLDIELGISDQEDFTKRLNHISTITQELSDMIESFISMFDFSSQKEKDSFLIQEAFDSPLKKLQPLIKKYNISLIFEIEPYSITLNKTLFEQALLAILQNSVEAFEKNIANITQRYILIKTKNEKDEIFLSIQDSAGGIQEEILPHIFEPYFSNKKVHSGSGMGLFLVKKIMENQTNRSCNIVNSSFSFKKQTLFGVKVTLQIC